MKETPSPVKTPPVTDTIVSIGKTLVINAFVFSVTFLLVRTVIRKIGRPRDKRRATIATVVLAVLFSRPAMVENKQLAAWQPAQTKARGGN